MHVSRLIFVPMTLVLAAPLDTGLIKPIDVNQAVDQLTPTGANGVVGSVSSTLNSALGTTFQGTPNTLGTTKDVLSTTLNSALPAGVPGTTGQILPSGLPKTLSELNKLLTSILGNVRNVPTVAKRGLSNSGLLGTGILGGGNGRLLNGGKIDTKLLDTNGQIVDIDLGVDASALLGDGGQLDGVLA